MIRLSERLQRIAELVRSGGVVADIGCDHAFTSIYLIQRGLASHVIAADVRRGPLERAKEHVEQYHLQEQIELRLSDGAKEICPGEVDTPLISGMGGTLIRRILQESDQVLQGVKELVLSPQSEPELVRHQLHEQGFQIDEEQFLFDQGKYYLILHAIPGQQSFSSEGEYLYGRYLVETRDPCFKEYLIKEKRKLEGILNKLSGECTETALMQKRQKECRLVIIDEILCRL